MSMRHSPIWLVMAALALVAGGCGSEASSSERANRATSVVETCRGHDGVAAFDDDAVICGDETAQGERGTRAVEACRGHDGVNAFDDDIVICRDDTAHPVEGG
jgi:hypothetical protein